MPGTSRSRPAAAAARNSSGVRTPSARAISTDRFVRQPEVAAEADEPGHELALELAQLGDLPGLDQLAQPRLDPGPDAAQLAATRPERTSSAIGTGAARIVSAARR